MTLKVTLVDVETGQTEEATVVDGDYLFLAASPCYLDGVQAYPLARTQVLTVKGFAPRKPPATEPVAVREASDG